MGVLTFWAVFMLVNIFFTQLRKYNKTNVLT